MNAKQYLIIPDLHMPHADKSYLSVIYQVLKKYGQSFAGLVQIGDFCDFYKLSSFDKSPSRLETITDELDQYRKHMIKWCKYLPDDAVIHQLEGNHEARFDRYINSRAPEIHMMVQSVQDYLGFDKFIKQKVYWHKYDKFDSCRIGDVTITHGFYFGKHVAVTGLDKYPYKLISGHTHRVQYASNGRYWNCTIGCGVDINKHMFRPVPSDWQQAFAVLTVVRGIGYIEITTINDRRCAFRGEYIHAKS